MSFMWLLAFFVSLLLCVLFRVFSQKKRKPTWFSILFGSHESSYRTVKKNFIVEGDALRSRVTGRLFPVGKFSCYSLKQLRSEIEGSFLKQEKKCLRLSHIPVRDIYTIHQDPEYEGALFQVASQFNCLEFPSASTTPEQGITNYVSDLTQGPACSLACPAATLFRNYFVKTPKGQIGQTRNDQVNNLELLETYVENDTKHYWDTKNGYTNSTPERLLLFNDAYESGVWQRDELAQNVKVGLHSDIEVIRTFEDQTIVQRVNQVFCSAISISYSQAESSDWQNVAQIVLDSVYESTLLAAVLQLQRGGSNILVLTFIGGGVFGNNWMWIIKSISKACAKAVNFGLDVRIAHYRRVDPATCQMIDEQFDFFLKKNLHNTQ